MGFASNRRSGVRFPQFGIRGLALGAVVMGAARAAEARSGIELIPRDKRTTVISSETDVDTYVFDGLAGGRLFLRVDALPLVEGQSLDPTFDVLDGDGLSILGEGDLSLAQGRASIRNVTIPGDGAYRVVVTGIEGSTGGYCIQLKAARPRTTKIKAFAIGADDVSTFPFMGIDGGSVRVKVKALSETEVKQPVLWGPGDLPSTAGDGLVSQGSSWVGTLPLDMGTGTYNLAVTPARVGESAVVRVCLQPGYTLRPPTDVILPFNEPFLEGVLPGTAQTNDVLTASGRFFSPRARVFLVADEGGEVEATVGTVAEDGTELQFSVPDLGPANYSVVVCNPEGQASGETISIEVVTLIVDSIVPGVASSGGGTPVTLTGQGFVEGVLIELVDGNGNRVAVDSVFVDESTVTFVAPAHAPGSVDVVATNPNRQPVTVPAGLTYQYSVAGVSPNQVPEGGGTLITVTGTGFASNVKITVRGTAGDIPVAVTFVNSNTLRFTAPPSNPGSKSLLVQNPGLTTLTIPDALTYISSLKVTSVAPVTSPTSGGVMVTVQGVGFAGGLTALLRPVSGPDAIVTPQGLGSGSFTFLTPAHAVGDVDLVLQNVGELPVIITRAITFTDDSESRFFRDTTASSLPAVSQSGDRFLGTRGAIVDLNLDGLNDILLQSVNLLPEGASLRILHQRAGGGFDDDTHRSIPDRFGGFATAADVGEGPGFAVGDIDGDSFPDVLIASTGFVPRTESSAWGLSAYVVGDESTVHPSFFSEACGKVGEYPIWWNDDYPATRVLKNDGVGNFFSSPFAGEGRRVPRVGFFVEDGPSIAADLRSYLATVVPTEKTFADTIGTDDKGGTANGLGDTLLAVNGDITEIASTGTVTVTTNQVVGLQTVQVTDKYTYTAKSDANRTLTLSGNIIRDYAPGDAVTVTYTSFDSSNDQGFVDNPLVRGGERFEGDAMALGDLDGNGSLDLVVAKDDFVTGSYCIEFQRGAGLDPFETWFLRRRPSTRVLLNGSGSTLGSFTESAFPILDPSNFAFPDTGYGDHGQASDVALGDVNADGLLDVIVVSDQRFEFTHDRTGGPVTEYKTGTRIFLNRGAGRFDDATRSNLPVVDIAPTLAPDFFAASRVILGDVDRDGDLDMILGSDTGTHILAGRPWTRVLINRNGPSGATGLFDDESTTRMPPVSGDEKWQSRSIALSDIDGDGDLDLLMTTGDPSLVDARAGTRVLINDGKGNFKEFPAGVTTDTFIPRFSGSEDWSGDLILTGDLNGDGVADILVTEEVVTPDAARVLTHK